MTDLGLIALAIVAIIAGIAVRRGEKRRGGLSDADIREIERTGRIDAEDVEALDVDEIRSEEDEFWARTWEEPEDPEG